MELITLYLKKFTNLVPHDRVVREGVAEILMKYSVTSIPLENIRVKKGTVFITASPLLKNIFFVYKEDVLKQLQERLEKNSISDMR